MSLRRRLLKALHPTRQVTRDNQIDLLCSGADYFPALLKALDASTHSIRLETYLYADDAIGDAVTQALCAAARRGVDVRLVVDGFGARNIVSHHLPLLQDAGVHVRIFRPEHHLWRHLLSGKRSRLCRMHRKMALCDGQTAFVGGINIIDDATGNPAPSRPDFALQISGPLLQNIGCAMDRQWQTLSRRPFLRRSLKPTATQINNVITGSTQAALALRDNLLNRGQIEAAYISAIAEAQKEITLAMAYFIPSRAILHALFDAAARGVTVYLLLQGRIEYRLQHYASQSLYTRLLNAGIRIFEYEPGFMHAKIGVVDHHWATVGSANLDPFSLLVAREANVLVFDAAFCARLEEKLLAEIKSHSREITAAHWARRSGWHRMLRALSARLLFRLLSLTRYANNY